MLLKNATKLRDSTDFATKSSLFINPDLTQIERQEGFALRSELRRRKAAGETLAYAKVLSSNYLRLLERVHDVLHDHCRSL